MHLFQEQQRSEEPLARPLLFPETNHKCLVRLTAPHSCSDILCDFHEYTRASFPGAKFCGHSVRMCTYVHCILVTSQTHHTRRPV